jgi:large subunit ribosomal protein L20
MPRVKRSVHGRKKRRKVLAQAKGYWGLKHSSYRRAKEQVEKSLVYAYRDRKTKKRTLRSLWIVRINAAARANGLSYNQFMAGLRKAEVGLDRKMLADLAVSDPAAFTAVAERAKAALDGDAERD